MLFLRIVLRFIFLLLALIVITPIIVVLFFNPNEYKQPLHDLIEEKSGLPLQIQGAIELKWFPWLGLKIEDVSLPQPPTFGEGRLMLVKEMHLKVPVRDLIQQHFKIETLNLKEVELHLIKQKNGVSNWEYYVSQLKEKAAKKTATPESSLKVQTDKRSRVDFALLGVELQNAKIDYRDYQQDQTALFTDFNLKGNHKEGGFPITAQFHCVLKKAKSTLLDKEVKLTTQLHADTEKMAFKSINLLVGNTNITGLATIPLHTKPITAVLNADQIALEDFQQSNVILKNVKTTLKVDGNQIKFNPLTANLNEGKLTAEVNYSLDDKTASTFQGNIAKLSIESLLHDLKRKEQVAGTASLDFHLAQRQKKTIEGIVKCQISDGVIHGIDLMYFLNQAQALLKKESFMGTNTKATHFDSLTATMNIHDNIIDNPNLLIQAPEFKASGEGNVNLSDQRLSYKLQAWRQYTDGKAHPNAYPLALRINGTVDHLKIEPDLDLYLKAFLDRELKKQVNKQLNQHTGSETPEEKLKRKLSKGVEKGLKKLFKQD